MKFLNKGEIQIYLAIVFLILLTFIPWNVAMARGDRYDDWHMGTRMMGNWGMGWFGGIFMILFWVIIIVGLVIFVRWLIQTTGRKDLAANSSSNALEILKERYARGDIDKGQFESMKRDLAK